MAKCEFKAESKRLLEMMIHSIYSEKDIFLRELISNASDAMDKLYYLSLTDEKISIDRENFEIRIKIDKENRYLRIIDRGIGMNAEDMEKFLGTIAKSDSKDFGDRLKNDSKETADSLIGQFGVGFYSAFMVADSIAVISRKYGEEQGYKWISNGVDGFTITPCEKKNVGTEIILRIRKEESEGADEFNKYLREYPIYKLVKQYSDYIRYPIKMYMPHPKLKDGCDPANPEYEEEYAFETLNSMVPLWRRNKSEVTDENRAEFYKEHFGDNTDPRRIITADVEGDTAYKALLYIPGKQPAEYGTDDYKTGLELYSSNVKIMDACQELLPEEYNFIRGIVDSPDISLNISREILQKNHNLISISKNLSKKIRTELVKMLRDDREEYEKFHEQFGHHLKVCAMDNFGAKKDTLSELLLFYSGKQNRQVTLDEYIEAMKPDQTAIYYANGENPMVISNIPQMEVLNEHDMDVLYFMDPADQFVAQMFGNYKGKKFVSIVNGDLGLEPLNTENGDNGENSELLAFIADTLTDRVTEVKSTNRLKSHPVCLTNGSGITFEMEKYFKSLSPNMPMKAKYILEVNTSHRALLTIDELRKTDVERAKKYCEILYNQSRMIAGLPVEDPSAYTDLIVSLW